MKILLVISFLIPIIYVGYLMSRLDNYLAGNARSISGTNSASAIVLGETRLAKRAIDILEEKGIKVVNLTEPFQLAQERKLCYLYALSDSDADNIAFCRIGKKLYCIENMLSICNDSRNENMFKSENINYLLREKTSSDKLLLEVLQQLEVKL